MCYLVHLLYPMRGDVSSGFSERSYSHRPPLVDLCPCDLRSRCSFCRLLISSSVPNTRSHSCPYRWPIPSRVRSALWTSVVQSLCVFLLFRSAYLSYSSDTNPASTIRPNPWIKSVSSSPCFLICFFIIYIV